MFAAAEIIQRKKQKKRKQERFTPWGATTGGFVVTSNQQATCLLALTWVISQELSTCIDTAQVYPQEGCHWLSLYLHCCPAATRQPHGHTTQWRVQMALKCSKHQMQSNEHANKSHHTWAKPNWQTCIHTVVLLWRSQSRRVTSICLWAHDVQNMLQGLRWLNTCVSFAQLLLQACDLRTMTKLIMSKATSSRLQQNEGLHKVGMQAAS